MLRSVRIIMIILRLINMHRHTLYVFWINTLLKFIEKYRVVWESNRKLRGYYLQCRLLNERRRKHALKNGGRKEMSIQIKRQKGYFHLWSLIAHMGGRLSKPIVRLFFWMFAAVTMSTKINKLCSLPQRCILWTNAHLQFRCTTSFKCKQDDVNVW